MNEDLSLPLKRAKRKLALADSPEESPAEKHHRRVEQMPVPQQPESFQLLLDALALCLGQPPWETAALKKASIFSLIQVRREHPLGRLVFPTPAGHGPASSKSR